MVPQAFVPPHPMPPPLHPILSLIAIVCIAILFYVVIIVVSVVVPLFILLVIADICDLFCMPSNESRDRDLEEGERIAHQPEGIPYSSCFILNIRIWASLKMLIEAVIEVSKREKQQALEKLPPLVNYGSKEIASACTRYSILKKLTVQKNTTGNPLTQHQLLLCFN
ncbi:hypothetical protein CFP56_007642 [Quercus suber]|uniref:Uncharacterized protein n=1 Tax=Quercus suber TaxID=58331 RepID=A0AAW0L4P6_QUESU